MFRGFYINNGTKLAACLPEGDGGAADECSRLYLDFHIKNDVTEAQMPGKLTSDIQGVVLYRSPNFGGVRN